MKKIIVFLCLCLATPAMAAEPTCNGGTLITTHSASDEGCTSATCNGKTFCKSDKTMNWWSAFTWCESQGRKLANLSKMCPNVSQVPRNEDGDCPNLQGKGDVGGWSSLAYDEKYALGVNLSSGAISYGSRVADYYPYAFCQ